MKTKIIFLIILSFYLSENAFAGEKVKQPINERKQWSDLCTRKLRKECNLLEMSVG